MSSVTTIDFSVGQATHPGLVREKNEDSFGWFSLSNGELFIVADGMGGYAGGAEASKRTIIAFKEFLESHTGEPVQLLEEALLHADSRVQEIGHANPDLSHCGSTIVVLFVSGSTGYFIHAGDSRLYLYDKGRLQQIGRDHSFVQDMLQAGVISRKEAENSPKNVITQSLGGNIDISRCSVEKCTISSGCSFLLCSDGLWGQVSEERLTDILSQSVPSSSKVNMMIKAAIDAGGPDNITAQLIEFDEGESQTQEIPTRKGYGGILVAASLMVLLVALAAAGYYAYRTWTADPSAPEPPSISRPEEQLTKQSADEVRSDPATDGKTGSTMSAPTADGTTGSEVSDPTDNDKTRSDDSHPVTHEKSDTEKADPTATGKPTSREPVPAEESGNDQTSSSIPKKDKF